MTMPRKRRHLFSARHAQPVAHASMSVLTVNALLTRRSGDRLECGGLPSLLRLSVWLDF